MQLKTHHHENVLSLKYILLVTHDQVEWAGSTQPELYLAFEYVPHDLSGIIAEPSLTLKEPMIKAYMQQLLRAVAHIHSHNVMHCDIKSKWDLHVPTLTL